MKIAFVVGSLAGGGAERVVAILATKMAQQGHDVSVMLLASTKKDYSLDNRVRIVDCTQKFDTKGVGFFKRVGLLSKALQEQHTQVCVSFTVSVNLYAVLACVGLKLRLILAERNDPQFDPVGKVSRFARWILYPLASGYVFQTVEEKNFFSKHIQSKSVVIPNPVNPDIPDRYNGLRDKRIVTAVRLEPQKNLKMAIDAFAAVHEEFPEVTFELYGEGSQRKILEQYIEEKSLSAKVFLKGNSKTLYEDIKSAYAFVLPSNYEGMSNALLEAMALGLPVISTDHSSGGARAVIEHGRNGLLIPVGDTVALAEAIRQLLADPRLAEQLGQNGMELRDKLHIETISENWIKYLESVMPG